MEPPFHLCTGKRSKQCGQGIRITPIKSAWNDLLETMNTHGDCRLLIILAFEPEPANVVGDAKKGKVVG